jgi:hypothetical protein
LSFQTAQGLNKSVAGIKDISKSSTELIQEELSKYDLCLSVLPDSTVALATARPRREGDVICPCSALHYDNMAGLLQTVNATRETWPEGATRILKAEDVAISEGRSGPIYSVLVGAASKAAPAGHGAQKRANATLVLDVTKGAGDQMVSLACKTRNGCGMAAKSVITIDMGSDWDPWPCCIAAAVSTKTKEVVFCFCGL